MNKRERGSGSLKLRGGIFWLRYQHAGTRVEESSGIRDDGTETARSAALRLLRKKTKLADTPAFVPPAAAKLTFEHLCEMLRADYRRKANRSTGKLDAKLNHLAEHFAGAKAVSITTKRVTEYADARLASGAKCATVNLELAALRRAFRVAVELDEYPASSVPKITTPDPKNARRVFLDPADAEAFMAELRQRESVVADVVELALLSTLRRENVLSLAWPMFSLTVERGHIVGGSFTVPGLKTKNGDPVTLPLTGRLLAVIDRRWQVRLDACPFVFHRGGRPVVMFEATWDAAAEAIGRGGRGPEGKRNLTFHDLRRSAARILRRAGVDTLTIMARGGWKTPSMFQRYSITDERDQLDAQAAMDAAMASPGSRKVVPLTRKAS